MSNIQKAAQTLLAASMRLDEYGYKNEADRLDAISEHLTRRAVMAARQQEEEIRRNTPRQRKITESPEQVLAKLYDQHLQKEAQKRQTLQPYDSCLNCSEYLFTGDQAYQVHDGTVLHLHCVPKYLEKHTSHAQRVAIACDRNVTNNTPDWSNLNEEQVACILPGRLTVLD